jgi:galactonate dehydratase
VHRESRKIAAAAESKSIAVAPHCPFGPIALAASLHLDVTIPNFLVQEQVSENTVCSPLSL